MSHALRRFLPFILRLLPLAFVLTACGTPEPPPGVKLGKPYSVNGNTYVPRHEPGYDKVGEASWYGPGFHGKRTANGEVFNQNDLTAAHPTLPMPSLVRVTNLSNGKSSIIRINDRGPFKSNRIIDLSRKSAQSLGIQSLAKVRVQYLQEETEEYLAQLKQTGAAPDVEDVQTAVEERRRDNEQIVEETHSNTRTGQTVADAAPVVSVTSQDSGVKGKDLPPPNDPGNSKVAAHRPDDPPPAPAKDVADVRYIRDETGKPMSIHSPPEGNDGTGDETASEKKLAAARPSAGEGGLHIQVGAFSLEENAKKITSSLSSIAAVSMGKIQAAGKELWRVRMGPFSSRDAAMAALEKVRAAGAPDAKILD